jgi:two-component system alkaline phosphatase synthesis response regulator PhoP
MTKILLVEDDKAILKGLVEFFTVEHFDVVAVNDGGEGCKRALQGRFDLIVLDLMLPTMNGEEVCRKLRAERNQTPVIMLTSKKQELDKVSGLESGADDYVTKPFSVRELLARVRAVLRRQQALEFDLTELSFDDVHVDFRKHEARKGSKSLRFSAKEFALLKFLAQHEGNVVSRDTLLNEVWGYEEMPTTRTVDNFILTLRKKIEHTPARPKHLLTIHTAGYKFVR